jgi:hypothetical protein
MGLVVVVAVDLVVAFDLMEHIVVELELVLVVDLQLGHHRNHYQYPS